MSNTRERMKKIGTKMRIFNFLFLDRNRETGERFARIDGGAEKTYQLR
jgi:hypothetical protein